MKDAVYKRLEEAGFSVFLSVRRLRELKENRKLSSTIPSAKGVYVILRLNESKPMFLEKGSGGYYKEKDPNVPIEELERNWVHGASIMYIGGTSNLKQRISTFLMFGEMKAVGHWGGRMVWQLADSCDLVVCIKTTQQDPYKVKKEMIQCFKNANDGNKPFANLDN